MGRDWRKRPRDGYDRTERYGQDGTGPTGPDELDRTDVTIWDGIDGTVRDGAGRDGTDRTR